MRTRSPQSITVEIDVVSMTFAWGSGKLHWFARPGSSNTPLGDKTASGLNVEASTGSDDPWFAFWCADCFDPSIYIVRAPHFEGAYDQFVEIQADIGHYLIKDGDTDYGDDDGTFTESGRRVDTECFQGVKLTEPIVACSV